MKSAGRKIKRSACGGFILVTALTCMLTTQPSCRHIHGEHGIPDSIPSDYWNHYTRGIAFSLLGEWAKAAHDFEISMGKTAGIDFPEFTEKRMSRTYGLHFIEDYYPHRELAVSYYYLERYHEAEKELELSLSMLPSSRAKTYLNKARQAILSQQSKIQSDAINFSFEHAADTYYTNQISITLDGQVSSPYLINRVTINNDRKFIELAEESHRLDDTVRLKPGIQRIRIDAEDLASNRAVSERLVIVDLVGPSISVSLSKQNPEEEVVVTIDDNDELSKIMIDGKTIQPLRSGPFRQSIRLKPARSIKIRAVDRAGNETEFNRRTTELIKASSDGLQRNRQRRLAMRVHGGQYGATAGAANRRSSITAIHRESATVMSDVAFTFGQDRTRTVTDTIKPRLYIHPSSDDHLIVTTELVHLDIEIVDNESHLRSFSYGLYNKTETGPALTATMSLSELTSNHHKTSVSLPVAPGINTFTVIAEDAFNNTVTRRLKIERRSPYHLRQDLRMTLEHDVFKIGSNVHVTGASLFPLAQFIQKRISVRFRSLMSHTNLKSILTGALLRSGDSPRFNIVARDEGLLKRILLEKVVRSSPLSDYRAKVAAGDLRAAEWLFTGKVSINGGPENWTIDGHIVDVETGENILHADIHFESAEREYIEYRMRGLVDKILQQTPIVTGKVVHTSPDGTTISLGHNHHIKRHYRCLFTSENNDTYNPVLTTPAGQWIQGKVISVDANTQSTIAISPENAADAVAVGDTMILR